MKLEKILDLRDLNRIKNKIQKMWRIMVNTLADACNQMKNAERAKMKEVIISPASNLFQRILSLVGFIQETIFVEPIF